MQLWHFTQNKGGCKKSGSSGGLITAVNNTWLCGVCGKTFIRTKGSDRNKEVKRAPRNIATYKQNGLVGACSFSFFYFQTHSHFGSS